MSRRRDLEQHRHSLDEIRDIMNSMKNLSYMETRRISTFLETQHNMVKHIETVAADFLSFYPETLTESTETAVGVEVYLLIGAERGFCGDFNHALLRHFKSLQPMRNEDKLRLICVGHKLKPLLENDRQPISFIDGASVAEEVDNVLNQIVSQLATIQHNSGPLNLTVLYHGDEHKVTQQQLLPPFQNIAHQQPQATLAPVLNIGPGEFLLDLSYQYLFVALYEILYSSLMAENRQRMSHLEGAVRHMDKQSIEMQRQSNVLRQEEIIEEIEVILLSAAGIEH